ncbi:Ldh family oxidoreductase [Massilia soli]|uniref:Ldh family oxidoreductase n=1 Tax=Massilia soli TaxID=2792854 RepID=A0ABS7SN69_9BURK|nr:Ldh family oxidoreductase [Massilia soli]MBZ2207492.1 Ldh family oxidoreductase [Massilia soli]
MPSPNHDLSHISFDDLRGLLASILARHGASPQVAAILADNCASVQRDGAESHGTFRIPGYLATMASGWVDAAAVPLVTDAAPGFVSVDARNGFAQPALAAGRALAVDKARANGIALLAIHNSHHFSALWPDVEPFARDGLVALAFVNSMACVVPHGARQALFGTNPIAFAAPRAGADPLVFDLATSAMAHGDVQIAAREGRLLPDGVGVDRHGQPTTAPAELLDGGALCTFGGHKGSALAMMVEILAAALTGGNFSFGFDWSGHPGAQTPRTGQLLIVIDPSLQNGNNFALRIETLVEAMKQAGQERQPGERRYIQRAMSERDGIPIPRAELDRLRALAAAT